MESQQGIPHQTAQGGHTGVRSESVPQKKLQTTARSIELGYLKILTLFQTSTMRYKVLFALLVLLNLGCTEEVKTVDSLLEQLPPNPTAVIKINNLPNFRSELKNNPVLVKI